MLARAANAIPPSGLSGTRTTVGGADESRATHDLLGAVESESTNQALQVEYRMALHHRLTARARQRVSLEAEEARDLVFAEEAGIWRDHGYVSMLEYMERELHHGPHATKERLRVANELFDLPLLAERFRSGEMPYSVVREVTRVAVPENEHEWLASTEGKTARQVERMVSGLPKGAAPDARPDPKLVRHRIVLEVDGERYAKWLALRTAIDDEQGSRLDDNAVVDAIASAPRSDGTSRPCLHAVTTCKVCKQSSMVAAGMQTPLRESARERLLCDSVEVGDLESEQIVPLKPNIPSVTRRKVFVREGFACAVPGCRSRRHLDIHHITFRSQGGTHALSNILLTCAGHHAQVHEGLLVITGRAPDELVFEFRRAGEEEPHLVLTSAQVVFEAEAEASVPRGTELVERPTC